MDEKVAAALIAGAVSIVVTTLGHLLGQRAQRDLAQLQGGPGQGERCVQGSRRASKPTLPGFRPTCRSGPKS